MNKMIGGFSDLSIPYNADYQDDQLTFKFNPDIIRSLKMLALKRNTDGYSVTCSCSSIAEGK